MLSLNPRKNQLTMLPWLALLIAWPLAPSGASAQQTFTNFQAASRVVGQANFTTNVSALTASGLNAPSYSAISAQGRLAVANQGGGRVMIWNNFTTNGQAADLVLGQPNFTSSNSTLDASTITNCNGVAFSPDGNKLIAGDFSRNRVLIWNTIPGSNGAPADVVVGQPNFTSSAVGGNTTGMNQPTGVYVSPDGRLLVADYFNNRVLVWNSIPTANGTPANVVIGQPDFLTSSAGTTASKLNRPWGIWVAPTGELLVVDQSNNRVMVWNAIPTSNGAPADRVIGQPNFTSNSSALSASGMNIPIGVTVSPSGQVAISEFLNHRVLIYNSIPVTNGAAANTVLGQANFTSGGAFAPSGTPTAQNLNTGYNASFDLYGRLFVAGRDMNRVLVFGTLPAQTANLQLTMSATSTGGCPNSPTVVTVTVNNTGPNTATGVRVSTSLPNGFTLGSSSATIGTYTAAGGGWNIGTIPNGGSAVLTLNGTTGSGGQYTAGAGIVASNQVDGNLTNNASNITFTITSGPCITTGAFTTSACGDGISPYVLPYAASGTFTGGNVFTAQLSNSAGSFASPTDIGSVVDVTSGSITCSIPFGTPVGSGYRVRVVGSTPATIGTNNGSDITIAAASIYYADVDGDGAGDPDASQPSCAPLNGYVSNSDDQCPDDANKIAPGVCGCGIPDVPTTWYADVDGDGLGDPATSQTGFTCDQPVGYVANNTDPCELAVDGIANIDENTCACELGYFATITDIDGNDVITACTICPPGYYCPDGLTSTPCPPGGFSDVSGATACSLCPANTYNDAFAQTECLACPFGQNSEPGATECSVTVICTTDLTIAWQTDGQPGQLAWELRTEGTDLLVQSGTGGAIPANAADFPTNTCLPDGTYYLVVTDSGGDGITGGGYTLRLTGGVRVIDNTMDNQGIGGFTSGGTSQVAGGLGFSIPVSSDNLITSSCDKQDWVSGQFIVANANPAVSAEWVPNAPNNLQSATTGYVFWFYNPNGGYSFRRFRSHATSDGFPATGPTRACHTKLNNWAVANHIPVGEFLNVKIRSRVNGTNFNWGPACRFVLDPVRAACPLTNLMDIPGNAYYSCGETKTWGGNNRVHAVPVSGATQYQFRYYNLDEGIDVTRTTSTYYVNLNWTPALPNGSYSVEVRAFKNGAWCATSAPWGDVCTLNIVGSPAAMGGNQNMPLAGLNGDVALNLYPNPNNGEQLTVSLSAVEEGVTTVAVDLFDLTGARVSSEMIAVQDGFVFQQMDMNGLASGVYMMSITAGTQRYTERLVIQK